MGNLKKTEFVVCIKNKNYEASLELRKIYRVIQDEEAERHQRTRIIDESGEDYLYPAEFFAPVGLTRGARKAFAKVHE